MQRLCKFLFFLPLLALSFFVTGCADKFIFPETSLEITSVVPYELIPTATDTASLPTTAITIKSLSKIPCNLKGYSINYFTSLGEEIPSAKVTFTPAELEIAAEAEVTFEIKAFSRRMVDIFELSSSQITPVTARFTLEFKDINGNHISRDAHCILHKPDSSS
ncbi:MAG: hypothetical protein ACD_39C01696G0004 [uncultured bacterium]|nr:MAG: hypothetical protein ACD_39C01696G0004 [uncultured bacterium]